MNIVICAVPFSPNLGDGAIFESIKSRYQSISTEAKVIPLDIAGRTRYEASNSNLDRIRIIPKPLRRYAVLGYCTLRYLTSWRKAWQKILKEADIITIGGGQLFLDEELNFPIKLYLLSRQLKKMRSRKNISFVGVSPTSSIIGRSLLKKAIKNINADSISVRDMESSKNMRKTLGITTKISVTPDPALYFEKTRQSKQNPTKPNKISICISSPKSLDAEEKLGKEFHQGSTEFYSDLIDKLYKKEFAVSIFSNGAPEDEQLKNKIHNRNLEKIHHCYPKPLTPSDLKNHISEADIVIAHRLHANIIAYSLGIPSIGLNWDSKVKSFFTAVQRLDYYLEDLAPNAESIIDLVESALKLKPEFLHEMLNKKIDEEISSHLKRN